MKVNTSLFYSETCGNIWIITLDALVIHNMKQTCTRVSRPFDAIHLFDEFFYSDNNGVKPSRM